MSAVKFVNAGIKVFRVLFILLAVAGIGLWAYKNFGPENRGAPPTNRTTPAAPEPEHLILVTYFTTDMRCPTCRTIESLTNEAIETGFAEELAAGTIRLQLVNFDRPENKHFAEKYELTVKTVVISDRRQGKEQAWAKFDEVWDHYDDPPTFKKMLRDGVRKYLQVDGNAS